MEPQSEAAADTVPAPEPPAEVVEAPVPAAPEPPAQEARTAPPPPLSRSWRAGGGHALPFRPRRAHPAGTADLDTLVGELAAYRSSRHHRRVHRPHRTRRLQPQLSCGAPRLSGRTESQRLDAQQVEAVGRGKNDPVTAPDECKGLRGKRLIKCLAPDRRVEIEVVGLATPAQ
jgi:OOP family OmpA-OmpF porin